MKKIYRSVLLIVILAYSTANGQEQSLFNQISTLDAFSTPDHAAVYGDYLYSISSFFSSNEMDIYDISDPSLAEAAGSLEFEELNPLRIYVTYDQLYVIGRDTGIKIYDLSETPEAPQLRYHHERVSVPDSDNGYMIQRHYERAGNLMFTNASRWRFMILDVTDLSNPQFMDSFEVGGTLSVRKFIAIDQSHGWLNTGRDLRRVDFSNPSNLVTGSSDDGNLIDYEGEGFDFVVHQDTAFVITTSTGPRRVYSIDLNNRDIIDEINIQDSLSTAEYRLDFHPETRRLAITGSGNNLLEIRVGNSGGLYQVRRHPARGTVLFFDDYLVTGNPAFSGDILIYSVGDVEDEDSTGTTAENLQQPAHYALSQNYPNPFNPTTVISYQLPVISNVKLEVFDLLGRRVATLIDGTIEAGRHTTNFEASRLAGGTYIYRLQAGDFVQTRKMMLVK